MIEAEDDVTSPIDHYNLFQDSLTRGVAAMQDDLEPIWSEKDIVDVPPPPFKVVVDAKVIKNAKTTRRNLHKFLDPSEATAPQILLALKAKDKFYRKTDRGWRVDYAIWSSMAGRGAMKRLEGMTVKCFEHASGRVATELEAVTALKALKTSKILAFVGPQAVSNLDDVISWVEALSQCRAPVFKKMPTSTLVTRVLQCMSQYARPLIAAGAPAAARQPANGKPTIDAMWKDINDNPDQDKHELLKKLTYVNRFAWVLDPAERKPAETKLNAALKASKMGLAVVEAAKDRVKKSTTDTVSMVAGLFAKRR